MATDAQYKASILAEVGAGLDGDSEPERAVRNIVGTNLDVYWDMYTYKNTYPMLQYAYVKLHCLKVIAGQLRTKIDKTLGPLSKRLSTLFQNALQLISESEKDIANIELIQAQSAAPVITRMDANSPFDQATMIPFNPMQGRYIVDPNDPRYTGSR